MSVFSKLWNVLFLPEWSFRYNCYETAHTWTPYCSEASLGIGFNAFIEGLKMYSALNTLQFIINRQYNLSALSKSVNNTLNSSSFLGTNAFLILALFCGVRRISGKFYYSLCAFIPSFVASYAAIFIERPHRRSALALYLINIASECLYRVAVKRQMLRPIPNGEIVLFTASMTLLMYIYRVRGLSNDPISLIIKTIIGREESKRGIEKALSISSAKELGDNNNRSIVTKNSDLISKNKATFWSRSHVTCPHKSLSCLTYIGQGFGKSFALSWSLMTIVSALKNPKKFLSDPGRLIRAARNGKNIKFGLFLGLFSATFRSVNCSLRRVSDGPRDWHAIVAGALASLSMSFSPNSTIATYVTWKAIENFYCIGFKAGHLPNPDNIIPVIYAACVSVIFYCGVLTPDTVRPSYIKFIESVTKEKIHLFNRNVLAVFGTGAEKGYEDFVPDLDPNFCSKSFIETNLIWLI